MSNAKFSVTFDIVDEKSAEHGEHAESGYIVEGTDDLREAIKALHATRTNRVDSGQGTSAEFDGDRVASVFVVNGMEFESGAYETRTLHIPREVSVGTSRRIAALAGAKVRPYSNPKPKR